MCVVIIIIINTAANDDGYFALKGAAEHREMETQRKTLW